MVELSDNNIKMSEDTSQEPVPDQQQPGDDSISDSPLQAMQRRILESERGNQQIPESHLSQPNSSSIKAGDKLKLYRMANRDVKFGEPATLEITVIDVDPDRHTIDFSGQYESSTQVRNFEHARLVVFPNGIIAVADLKQRQHGDIYIRIPTEPILLFKETANEQNSDDATDVDSTRAIVRKRATGGSENPS